jgi:hypothetical protein
MVEMREMDWTDVIGESTELRTRPSMATTLGKKISKRTSGKSVGREVFGVGLNREGAEYKHCGSLLGTRQERLAGRWRHYNPDILSLQHLIH